MMKLYSADYNYVKSMFERVDVEGEDFPSTHNFLFVTQLNNYRIPPHSVTHVTLFETNKPVTLART